MRYLIGEKSEVAGVQELKNGTLAYRSWIVIIRFRAMKNLTRLAVDSTALFILGQLLIS
jgi:hypothetical protein